MLETENCESGELEGPRWIQDREEPRWSQLVNKLRQNDGLSGPEAETGDSHAKAELTTRSLKADPCSRLESTEGET